MTQPKKLILDERKIDHIIRRIAYQIHENNMDAKSLVIVGICGQGVELAGRFSDELRRIDDKIKVGQLRIDLDKTNPKETAQLSEDVSTLSGKSVVLVDDVLNTGKILTHGLQVLLAADVKKIETAVLVDRGHPQFPISATFSGYQLSTTLEEHIEVKLGKKPGVYLY